MDAAEKLMLDLIGEASRRVRSLAAGYSKTSQGKDQRCCEQSLAIL